MDAVPEILLNESLPEFENEISKCSPFWPMLLNLLQYKILEVYVELMQILKGILPPPL